MPARQLWQPVYAIAGMAAKRERLFCSLKPKAA